MKKFIHHLLDKRDLRMVNQKDYRLLHNDSLRLHQMVNEHYLLARAHGLDSLAATPNEQMIDMLTKLIGTSPYEGLYILNALYGTRSIDGAICEMGVAQGATTRLIGTFLLEEGVTKDLAIFDSFQGLSRPTEEDELKDDIFQLGRMEAYEGEMAFGEEIVLGKLREIGFPPSRIQVYAGYIDEVIANGDLPEFVSFAYIDFDLYAPIRDGLEMIHPRLSQGGVIVVDDYDFFSTGAKQAVDEFVERNRSEYELTVPDQRLGHFAALKKSS